MGTLLRMRGAVKQLREANNTAAASVAEPSVQELIAYEGKKADLVKQIAPGVQNVATGQGFFFVAVQNISEVQPGGRLENVDLFIPYCCATNNDACYVSS